MHKFNQTFFETLMDGQHMQSSILFFTGLVLVAIGTIYLIKGDHE